MGKTEKYDHMKLIREYAGGHKKLITWGRCLAAVSAVMTLIPYYELWRIIRTAVNGENLDDIKVHAWSAVSLIIKILETLDLKEYADKHPLALSGGQKQRVAVASAIASSRNVILFDEPTSGLDYVHMLQVSELLNRLREQGKTVIIVTHDIELIKNACTVVIPFAHCAMNGL